MKLSDANAMTDKQREASVNDQEDTSPSLPGGVGESEIQQEGGQETQPVGDGETAEQTPPEATGGDAQQTSAEKQATADTTNGKPAVPAPAGEDPKDPKADAPRSNKGEQATEHVAWFLGLSKQDVGFMFSVLIAGLIGAWCAKIAGREIMVFEFNGELATPVGWLGSGFIGAIAAGLGVYLLANSDTTDKARTIFFAVGCGLCGQIIIAKTISTIEDSVGMKGRSAHAQKALIELKEAIARDTSSNEDEPLERAHDWIIALIERARAAESNGDFEQTAQIEGQACDLVTSIVVLSKSQPIPVLEELRRIIAWADQSGADQVKRVALGAVKTMLPKSSDEELLEIKALKAEILNKWKDEGAVVEEVTSSEVAAEPEPKKAEPVEPPATTGRVPASVPEPGTPQGDAPPPVGELAPAKSDKPTIYGGRVYLELDRESLKKDLTKLKTLAAAQGYTFIIPKSPSDPDFKECRVQYYRPEDKPGADELMKAVESAVDSSFGLKRKEPTLVKGIKGARPKHYDLRIGRDVIDALIKTAAE